MSLRDLFGGLDGPVFIKDNSDAEKELEYLKSLPTTPEIEREIKFVQAGIAGEKNIKYITPEGNQESSRSSVPICKRCGVPMVKGVAKKGKNAGKEFWGCPNYPHCRYIIPIGCNDGIKTQEYTFTAYVKEASSDESTEILSEIEKLSDDDMMISSSKRFTF